MAAHILTSSPPTTEDGGANLLEWVRTLRRTGSVWQEEQTGLWHVLDHAPVQRVLSDAAVFSSNLTSLLATETLSEGNYLQMDPPLHQKYRGLVNKAFTARAVRELAPRITEVVGELLEEVDGQDRFDLVETLAHPMPVIVLAELLGVPDADRGLLRKWADGVFRMNFDARFDPEQAKVVDAAVKPLHDYLLELVRERRRTPREDLISRVVHADMDGAHPNDEESVTAAAGLLLAGHLTSTLLLGNAVRCLQENPAVADSVRAEPGGIPAVVEEVTRYLPPFSIVARLTKVEVELDSVTIPAGSVVLPSLLAANRDPAHFDDPDSFDPARTGAHVAFGYGVHHCVGAPLGRLESAVALGVLLKRYPRLRLDESEPPEYFSAPGLFGAKRLPVAVG